MSDEIYFDHAATTYVDERVIEAMLPHWREGWGNPNSLYAGGRRAAKALEDARERFAALLGAASPTEIVFTSGGTESDNAALFGIADAVRSKRGEHVVVSAYEHPGVLYAAQRMAKRGYEVTYLKPRTDGLIHAEDLAAAVRDDTSIVSIMHGNNEIGTLNDIAALAAVSHEAGALFHTDAVQTLGKAPFDAAALGVDAASFSAHKIYAPKGIGALYLKRGTPFTPQIVGGGQESKKRPGTQNVAGAAGLTRALELMDEERATEWPRLAAMRDAIVDGVRAAIPNVDLNGEAAGDARLPHIANLIIKGIEGEAMLLQLDNLGIAVSTGSACSSGSLEPSHVLLAIGCPPELAHGSLRISLGRRNTERDVARFLEVFPPIVEKLRAMSPVYDKMFGSGATA